MKSKNLALIAAIGYTLSCAAPLRATDPMASTHKSTTVNFLNRTGTACLGVCKLGLATIALIGGTLLLLNGLGIADEKGNILKDLSDEQRKSRNSRLGLGVCAVITLSWGAINIGESGIKSIKSAF